MTPCPASSRPSSTSFRNCPKPPGNGPAPGIAKPCLDWDWYDAVFEDFETVCGLLGVTLRTRTLRLMGGGTREAPNLWFTGFARQGDGASFDGTYHYAPGAAHAIRSYAPKDETLHAIADELQQVQRRNFHQ